MFSVKLTSNPHHHRDLCQLDWRENPLPRDQQTHIVSQVPIQCSSDDNSISLAFYLRGEIPLSETRQVEDRFIQSLSVAATIARSAFAYLPKCHRWNWYGLMDIRVVQPFEIVSNSTPPLSIDVEIFPDLAKALQVETKMRQEVATVFEKAKDFLWDRMGSSLNNIAANVREAARFFDDCRACEVWSNGSFMDDSRYKTLRPYIEHLLRLKDASHPNVRDSGKVRDIVYLAKCPQYWARIPPQPAHYQLGWL